MSWPVLEPALGSVPLVDGIGFMGEASLIGVNLEILPLHRVANRLNATSHDI